MAKRKVAISDIIHATTISDETCIRKLARFNHILSSYYRDLSESNAARIGECFSGTGEFKIVTKFPIVQIHGFYGKGKGACFVSMDNNCACGICDTCLTKRINISESEYHLDNFQYRVNSDSEISVRIDCGVKDGYIVYSRGFKQIESLSQEIEMSIEEQIGFSLYIEIFYAELNKEFQKAAYYQGKYEKWLQKLKDKQDILPVYVGRSYLPNI